MFIVEDELHAAPLGRFDTFQQAIEELQRLANIPWDEEPNQAPCKDWRTCGRMYVIAEYEDEPYGNELQYREVLEISASGVAWKPGFEHLAWD